MSLDFYLVCSVGKCGIAYRKKGMAKMALMATIFFLILVNFFVAFARQQKKGWIRIFLFIIAGLTLLVAILFGIRALSS